MGDRRFKSCFSLCVGVYLCFLSSEAVSVYVEAFDEIVQGSLAQYLSLSQKIGGDVQKHVRHSSHDKHASLLLLKSPAFVFSGLLTLLFSFQADLMKQGFSNQRQLLLTASTSQKPSDVGQAPTCCCRGLVDPPAITFKDSVCF